VRVLQLSQAITPSFSNIGNTANALAGNDTISQIMEIQ
jgi:hypothetical protein